MSFDSIGSPVTRWWSSDNQIAFSRGNHAFLVINKAGVNLDRHFDTGMPKRSYCDVISSDVVKDKCTGNIVNEIQESSALFVLPVR